MNKINKFVVAVTLLLFLGQSFAAIKMSCEIPDYLSSMSQSAMHEGHIDSGLTHTDNHHDQKSVTVLEKVPPGSDCGLDQHSCQCSIGTCASAFLPVSNNFVLSHTVEHYKPVIDIYHSHQPSLSFRPPILA